MLNLRHLRVFTATLPLVALLLVEGCSADATGTGATLPVPEQFGPDGSGGKAAFARVIPTDTRPPVVAAKPPPPISGGTLLITNSGATAVVADPDRDRFLFVGMASGKVEGVVSVNAGDEPGRLVQDPEGRVHAILRGGGAIVSLDPVAHSVLFRRAVCGSPRGIAVDSSTDLVYVACADGDLVAFPTAGGEPKTRQFIETDLRDVVVRGTDIVVSRFRSPELIVLSKLGAEIGRMRPRAVPGTLHSGAPEGPLATTFEPTAAYRTLASSSGQLLMLHQVATDAVLDIGKKEPEAPSPYGAGANSFPCESIVQSELTGFSTVGATQLQANTSLSGAVLAVDLASSPNGSWIATASAGLADVNTPQPSFGQPGTGGTFSAPPVPSVGPFSAGSVMLYSGSLVPSDTDGNLGCSFGTPVSVPTEAQPIAVAFSPANSEQLVVQSREPARLYIVDKVAEVVNGFTTTGTFPGWREVDLGGISVRDTGHDIFNRDSGAGIACASCHPEGTEDGRVWKFSGIGSRRTQSLHNGLAETQPFHWDGDLGGMSALVDEVFVRRMGGVFQSPERLKALEGWLFGLKAPPSPRISGDPAVQRGKALFESAEVGCSGCHSGAKLTDNLNRQVRNGEPALQTPSLIGISRRAPFMHDGCAPTLSARFTDTSCGGGDLHGHTSSLGATEVQDLVAYMESL